LPNEEKRYCGGRFFFAFISGGKLPTTHFNRNRDANGPLSSPQISFVFPFSLTRKYFYRPIFPPSPPPQRLTDRYGNRLANKSGAPILATVHQRHKKQKKKILYLS